MAYEICESFKGLNVRPRSCRGFGVTRRVLGTLAASVFKVVLAVMLGSSWVLLLESITSDFVSYPVQAC